MDIKLKNNQSHLRGGLGFNRAFLLIEAELAVAILLTIVIIAISSLSHLLRAQRDNKNYLSALIFADQKLQELHTYGTNQTVELLQSKDFSFSYKEQPLEDYNITQLDITVEWEKKPRKNSFGLATFVESETEE